MDKNKNKKPRALIIDDEPMWLDQLADLLEEEGYIVHKAATREEAEYYLSKHLFDLAVVDVNLTDAPVDEQGEPLDQQGLELISAIRGLASKKEMAIVIVTGYGTRKITRQAFKELGVNDVLFKQEFDIDEFKKVVNEAVADVILASDEENN